MNTDARTVTAARARVAARVSRMIDTLHARDPDVLERLRRDPVNELTRWSDLAVVALPSVPPGGCSIAGVYLSTESPPRIGIWEQMTRPRASFTALHELGHHLQQTDGMLIDELDEQPDGGSYMEERTSDAFAARVLLPLEMVTMALGSGTPTVDQIVSLWQQSGASRAAVCVAAAQQLESPGHVVLLDDGIVQFSSSSLEPPLRRGSDQSATRIIGARARSALRVVTADENRFFYRDHIAGTPMYAQAANIGGYTVVVAVTHAAPWRVMSLPTPGPAVQGRWQTCGSCDHIFQVWTPRCERCDAGHCPECGRCDCETRVVERLCEDCWLMKPAQTFVGERCEECSG